MLRWTYCPDCTQLRSYQHGMYKTAVLKWTHPASSLGQAFPDRGSKKGSHILSNTVSRLMKKPCGAACAWSIFIFDRSLEFHSKQAAIHCSMFSLVSCHTNRSLMSKAHRCLSTGIVYKLQCTKSKSLFLGSLVSASCKLLHLLRPAAIAVVAGRSC